MLTFFICLAILIVGYFLYGKYVEKVFGISKEHCGEHLHFFGLLWGQSLQVVCMTTFQA